MGLRLLVTGGAGFIGSNLVDALLSAGHSVVVVDNFSTGFHENLNPNAELVTADICELDWYRFFESHPTDTIYHLAAQMDVRKSVADPLFDFSVNMTAGVKLVNAAASSGVKRFIFSSSGGAGYGSVDPAIIPVPESFAPVPESPYGAAKMAFDLFLSATAATKPITFVSCRLGNVYGPRQNPWGEAGVVAIFTEQMESGRQPIIFGDGNMTRDYVYVGDVVRALTNALTLGDNRWLNIGTGIEVTVDEVFSSVKIAACIVLGIIVTTNSYSK